MEAYLLQLNSVKYGFEECDEEHTLEAFAKFGGVCFSLMMPYLNCHILHFGSSCYVWRCVLLIYDVIFELAYILHFGSSCYVCRYLLLIYDRHGCSIHIYLKRQHSDCCDCLLLLFFSPMVQFELLHKKFALSSSSTKALLLSAYIKLVNLFPEIKEHIQQVSTSIEFKVYYFIW